MSISPIDPKARHISPYSTGEKIARALWYIVEATLFRCSLRTMHRWRGWLLRRFGAKIDSTARIRRTATIEIPWHLTIGPDATVGDHVILYCLGPVSIGARAMLSQYSHVCAGTHDHTRPDLPLVAQPIIIGEDVWIAADVFVGPGVTIGNGALVGARSSVFSDLPPWKICVGSPAKPVKEREFHPDSNDL